jgi:hypothetical protein
MLKKPEASALAADLYKLERITRAISRAIAAYDRTKHHALQLDAVADALAKLHTTISNRANVGHAALARDMERFDQAQAAPQPLHRVPPSDFIRLLGGD